jgi:putative tryptophan/tyrosine transport system substrate-binding protein
MRRRDFMIVTVGGLVTLGAAQALARKPAKPARVGYVWIGARGSSPDLDGLLEGLADLGYAVGRNLLLEQRYADGHSERLPALIAELLALNVDVLLTPAFQTTLAARRATSTVPIVSVSEDPVGAGLVASLSRPGGNITGLSLFSGGYSATWLGLLKDAAPTLHRIAVLSSPDSLVLVGDVERMLKAAPKLGLDVAAFSARPEDIDSRLGAIATPRPDGLVVCDAPLFILLDPTAAHRLRRPLSPAHALCRVRRVRAAGRPDVAFGEFFRPMAACGRLCRSHPDGRTPVRAAH